MDTNYGISMNSILRMDILHDARLLAGASGTDQIVTSVSVMVDPNIVSAVTGGELLVSTAYAIRENIPQLMQLVPQLKEHGVVGLGLKFNSYINEMPQNILDLCNELSFPLFEIPNSISFSQIITPIMTTIVNNQAQTLGDIYELQKALTATMLGGGTLQSISMYEMENNHKATFLDDLLVHDEERQRKSLANAEYFDFDVDAEHRVAVIRVLSGSSTIGNSSLYKTNNSIVNILRRISRDSSIKVLFVNKCDSIVLVFESPLREDEEYRRLLQAFIDTALSSLEAEGILAMASIGVGRSYADATSLWKSFNEARRAAACWNIDNSRVHYFEKLGVYRFLSYENLRPELIIFYNETLKVLVDYDHDRDSELVHTLSLYFKCGGNLKRLAEEMGVHYNTVAYRIQRIKELAHVSFDNADQMLNLQIALKIYEVNFHR